MQHHSLANALEIYGSVHQAPSTHLQRLWLHEAAGQQGAILARQHVHAAAERARGCVILIGNSLGQQKERCASATSQDSLHDAVGQVGTRR